MTSIKLPKGYDLKLQGRPSTDCESLPQPDRLALLPERLPFIKPRLLVKEGVQVQIGTPLIEDKRDSEINGKWLTMESAT
mgnify:CR=1 FL=1